MNAIPQSLRAPEQPARLVTFAVRVDGEAAVFGNEETRWLGHRMALLSALSGGQCFVARVGAWHAPITAEGDRLVARTADGENLMEQLPEAPPPLEQELTCSPPMHTAIAFAVEALRRVDENGTGIAEAMWQLEITYAALQRRLKTIGTAAQDWEELRS